MKSFCCYKTGLIRTKARIDYESIKEITLDVSVSDTGIPQLMSSAQLMIDVINTNDNEPIFTQPEYRLKVLENSPKGTVVGKIEATDNDDGTFHKHTLTCITQLNMSGLYCTLYTVLTICIAYTYTTIIIIIIICYVYTTLCYYMRWN